MTRQDFVKKYNNLVQQITKGSGIFPETVFSAAILESQKNGQIPGTLLATKYNNLFGIKDSSGWDGETVNLKTGEVFNGQSETVSANFRVYNSPEDSFKDYIKFLQDNDRYKANGVFNAKTVIDQAAALQKSGYATNPNYGALISSIAKNIDSYITPLNVGIGITILVLMVGTILYFNHE